MAAGDDRNAFRVAAAQMRSGIDRTRNIADACALIAEAAEMGAHFVATPEMTTAVDRDAARLKASLPDGEPAEELQAFSAAAERFGLFLLIGSMPVKENGRMANRSFLFGPDGGVVARYDKIHMFDVTLPGGEIYRESKNYRPGDTAVLADLPWGRLGITICYDLRFPHLYRRLAKAGAQFIAIPSAFTVPTGEAHWHAILRARAIETQCYVLAAAQGGTHEAGRKTYGHSLVVSPWGEIVAEARDIHPSVVLADVDVTRIEEARQRVPSLEHDRPFEISIVEADQRPAAAGAAK